MKTKIAINGFGRIGRAAFKQALDMRDDFEVVAINDLASPENLAYLLRYDSAYGRYNRKVEAISDGDSNFLEVGDERYPLYAFKNPEDAPWGSIGAEVIIESTGIFATTQKARAHIRAGAKRVVISAPAKDEETPHILMGTNHSSVIGKGLSPITSNASCTTNAVSPLMVIFSENPGIVKSMMTTIHGYTSAQSLVDSSTRGEDFLRGRAAAMNIIPSKTGAAKAMALVIPELRGKFDAISARVPVITGSLVDLTFLAKRKTSVDEVNEILTSASSSERWRGILEVSDHPLVSTDIIGNTNASIIDASYTRVVDGDLVKVLSWYDNEWGYTHTLLKHIKALA